MARLLTMLEKLVTQYSTKTINPAVKSGLRLRENRIPTKSPIAARNSVTSMRERAIRKNSPQSMPERNRASAKKRGEKIYHAHDHYAEKTVNAFAQ